MEAGAHCVTDFFLPFMADVASAVEDVVIPSVMISDYQGSFFAGHQDLRPRHRACENGVEPAFAD